MSAAADFDAFVDPQVGALLTLCVGAVNANVTLADGSPDAMVRSSYPWPVPRKLLASAELPSLLIYRGQESTFRRTVGRREQRVAFFFEYVMPPATDERAQLRWGALQAVWHELVRVVSKGHDPAVASDALILKAAGFRDIDESDRGRRVDYERPKGDTDVFPAFVGQMTLNHRDEIDLSALQDLVDLDAQLRLQGLPENEQPLVEQILTTPTP
jgi:hypothetical protein